MARRTSQARSRSPARSPGLASLRSSRSPSVAGVRTRLAGAAVRSRSARSRRAEQGDPGESEGREEGLDIGSGLLAAAMLGSFCVLVVLLDEIAQAQIRTITLLVCTRSSQPCEGHDFGEFCARSVLITSGPRRTRRSFSSCTWASEHTCATTRPRCVKGVSASRRHNVLLCSSGSNRFRAYTRACDCPLLHMCMCACACSSRARITSAWR